MAVDTPAKIAIIGAGPIGLEAALYARFLGYDVVIFERGGEVASHVKRWGHVRMFTPFSMNRSSLGLAAIATHHEEYRPPAEDSLLTGNEWYAQYLAPLAETDLLSDHLRLGTEVKQIGKYRVLKGDLVGVPEREDYLFRLMCVNSEGKESYETADVVIDTSGLLGTGNWLGEGGIPALGEIAFGDRIERGFPEILGRERAKYAGQHTVLVGSGMTAATHAVQLAQLATEVPGTRVTWITRWSPVELEGGAGPIASIMDDSLAARKELVTAANSIAHGIDAVAWLKDSSIQQIQLVADEAGKQTLQVVAESDDGTTHTIDCDQIIASVGFRPNHEMYRELQVHECYASEGPMRLAAKLHKAAQAGNVDCMTQPASEREELITSEPHFYLLGSKSYGRRSSFLFQTGLDQVRSLFQILGDRATLDLYATSQRLREAGNQ